MPSNAAEPAELKRDNTLAVLVFIAAGTLWLVGFSYLLARLWSDLTGAAGYGQFGDSFGWINSFFSMLAFAAIAASLILQRRELQATLNEIRITAKAQQDLAASAEKERHSRTTELGLTFFGHEFREVRAKAWSMRNRIKANPDFAAVIARAWIVNDTDSIATISTVDEGEKGADQALQQVVEFYVFLHEYFFDHPPDERARLINYYRYPYWRGTLLKLADACEQVYLNEVQEEQRRMFPLPIWIARLRLLDQKSLLPPYDAALDPIR